jgi:hypothetical protein
VAKRLGPAILIVGLLCGASAAAVADRPVNVLMPQISFTFNPHIAPEKLLRGRRTGVSVRIDVRVRTEDKSHPPALQELLLEFDKNVAINAAGLPDCRPLPIKDDSILSAGLDCHEALVGTGVAEFEIAFPEQPPFISPTKVQAFSAGVTGGKTKLILQAHLRAPVSAFLLVPVTVSKVHDGLYGLEGAAKLPKVAGGYGSLTSLSLKLGREFAYRGQPQSYLLAKCPNGHLQAKGIGVFSNGTRISGTAVRSCVGERFSGGANRADRSGRWAPAESVPRLRGGARRAAASAG